MTGLGMGLGIIANRRGGIAPQAASLEDGGSYPFTGAATYPASFHDDTNSETWLSWEAWNGVSRCVKCAVYDHDTDTWGEEYVLSHDTLTDDGHGSPAICMDSDGYVHAFFGCHADPVKHCVTLNPRDNSAWLQLDDIGTSATYPHPVLVGTTIYLFTREDSLQSLTRRKITGTGMDASVGSAQNCATYSGGRFYIGTVEADGTDIHIISTYADSGDTYRRGIYHYIYDTTSDALENSTGSVSTAVGSQPLSKATADASYKIFNQTTNDCSIPVMAFTSDGKWHAAFHDGATTPVDIRHMVFSGGAWSSASVVTTSSGFTSVGTGGAKFGEIALVPNSDNTVELWWGDDDAAAYDDGGIAKRIIRSSGGTWGSEETIATPVGSYGISRFAQVRNGHADLKVLFAEDEGSELDSAAGGVRGYAYGDGGFVARTVALGAAPSAATETVDPYWYHNALVATFDGADSSTSFTDDSRHAHTLTANGGAQILSNKLELNGTNAYVTAPFSLLWVPGSTISVEAFGVEFDDDTSTQTVVGAYRGSAGLQCWFIYYVDGVLVLRGSNDGRSSPQTLATAPFTPATDGTEYDIGTLWDGRSVAITIDGVVQQRSALGGEFIFPTGQVLSVGANLNSSGSAENYFNGRIAALRITRGTDRSGQVNYERHALPLPTTAPTKIDPYFDNVMALVSHDETMKKPRDFGPLDLPLYQSGTVSASTSIEPFADCASISFGGGKLYCPDDPLLEIGSGDFTVETFVRHKSVGSAGQSYIGKYNASTSQRSWVEQFSGWASPDVLTFVRSSNGTSADVNSKTGTYTPTVDTWFHTATCRSGSDTRKFIDGTQSGSTVASVNLFNSTVPLGFGGTGTTANAVEPLDGYAAEMRITKAARYTSGFTVPTSRFPRG